jgi:hypothetical protein
MSVFDEEAFRVATEASFRKAADIRKFVESHLELHMAASLSIRDYMVEAYRVACKYEYLYMATDDATTLQTLSQVVCILRKALSCFAKQFIAEVAVVLSCGASDHIPGLVEAIRDAACNKTTTCQVEADCRRFLNSLSAALVAIEAFMESVTPEGIATHLETIGSTYRDQPALKESLRALLAICKEF